MTARVKLSKLKSSLELAVFKQLKNLTRKFKFKIEYETETLPYAIYRNYIPDFIITKRNNEKIYIEAKGYLRPDDRTKLMAIKSQHPDKDIRLLFERNNKISKKSKAMYSDWATRHGWTYAIGEVPKEWFEE